MEDRKVISIGKPKDLNELETLNIFINELRKKDCLYKDVKKYITQSQQIDSQFVGKKMTEDYINGLWELVNCTTEIKIKSKLSTNKLIKTFKLSLMSTTVIKMYCTVVKENNLGKPDINGIWGVNVETFKLVKP
jgi:GTP-sensing pleiotropic transcriptional regulator CodY